jgi:hypothetical protein
MAETSTVLIVLSVFISVAGILIMIIYGKSKIFHSYPYYFNIFYILTIMLNNLIRLLPGREDENEFKTSTGCYIQGIILTVLDKLMLTQITSYSVIYYLGSFHSEIFEKHKMLIFLLLSEIGFAISMILATVFSFKGMSVSSQYCYVRTRDNTKYIVDTIITTLLWATSVFCTLRLLINLVKIKKEVAVFNRKADSITYHTCRFSFNLVFNVLIFLYVDLLINKKLTWMINWLKDFIYIFLSFVGEIFFTINSEVWKESKRILTCKKLEVEEDDNGAFFDKEKEEKEMTDK